MKTKSNTQIELRRVIITIAKLIWFKYLEFIVEKK